ncbi:MAG: outer membrane beta-barrel protein [Elusimicrobia bacterium]|nr:outer membrane beta-barrel protein [Elusimicrobiota bacterium]
MSRPGALSWALLGVLALPRGAGAWGFLPGSSGAGLRLGVHYPTATNGLDLATRSGYGGGFHYFHLPSEWFQWGFELDGLYMRKGTADLKPGETPGNRFSAVASAAFLTGRLNLIFERSWTLYVLGGGGTHQTWASLQTPAGKAARRDPGLAVLAAAGVETFLLKDMSVAFEARYLELRLDRGQFGIDAAETLAYQAGLSWWFDVQ